LHLTNKNNTFASMKQLLLTITLAFLCIQYNQAQTTTERISYVSPKQDTLILPDNELGKLIAQTWVKPKKLTPTPVILFTDEETIKFKNEVLFANRRLKNNSLKN